jgi:hypothetical protein
MLLSYDCRTETRGVRASSGMCDCSRVFAPACGFAACHVHQSVRTRVGRRIVPFHNAAVLCVRAQSNNPQLFHVPHCACVKQQGQGLAACACAGESVCAQGGDSAKNSNCAAGATSITTYQGVATVANQASKSHARFSAGCEIGYQSVCYL